MSRKELIAACDNPGKIPGIALDAWSLQVLIDAVAVVNTNHQLARIRSIIEEMVSQTNNTGHGKSQRAFAKKLIEKIGPDKKSGVL